MQVFEVVVLSKPTKKQVEEGAKQQILIPVTSVLAGDGMGAAVKVIVESKQTIVMDEVEVIVRPFN